MSAQQKAAEKEDPRQRRSKRRLSEALLALVAERRYRDISVVDICQRATVHRTTFYAHFEDKNALFRYVLEEQIQEAARNRPEITMEHGLWASLREELAIALRFCNTHRELYLTGMAGGGQAEMKAIEDRIARKIQEMVLDNYPCESPYMAEMTGRFYAGSLMSVTRWWMEQEIPLTEEELLTLMGRLLPERWEEK